MSNGSGLRVNSFLKVYIDVANYEPINEGGYIELTRKLKTKQAIIKVIEKEHGRRVLGNEPVKFPFN